MIMTGNIKGQIQRILGQREISQYRLSKMAKVHNSSMSRMLHGEHEGITQAWQRVLTALDLELIAVPKDKLDDVKRILEAQ